MHKYLLFLVCLMGFCPVWAQEKEYMYELGPGMGASWLHGDVNRSSTIYSPQTDFSLVFRYNVNLRWAIAVDADWMRLKGDSRDFDNVFVGDAQWTFNREYCQLSVRPEFSFWNYGWGADYREKHRVAPFLTTGIGFGCATGSSSGSDKTATLFSVPVGLGVKWKMAPRWDLSLTALWTKAFGDDIDGITDPYKIGTQAPVNTDWIGSVMVHITWSFKEQCFECHNQNE